MKLNPDCIRDILLTAEDTCDFSTPWTYDKDKEKSSFLANYSHEEIVYHIRQCYASDLIDGVQFYEDGSTVYIGDLTPDGHEFLANIRNDTFFNKVKAIAEELGVTSLNNLSQIAVNCAALIIKSHFGLP